MTLPTDVYADPIAEDDALDELVGGLDAAQWAPPTPAPGWTITHQFAHLSSVTRIVRVAASDPRMRGRAPPAEPFRFELTAPSEAVREFGPTAATSV